MPTFVGTRAVDNGPHCQKCGIRAVRFEGAHCRICGREDRSRFLGLVANMFMLSIGVLLLVMAASCAVETWRAFR